jgi:DNA-binding XRE family transcriptional regulator
MTIQFEKLKASARQPRGKAEYDALAPEYEIAAELLRARLRAGLSQAELAAQMGTSQSTIARLENGQTFRAPRHCYATPRQLAANSMCGCRRPDAPFKPWVRLASRDAAVRPATF